MTEWQIIMLILAVWIIGIFITYVIVRVLRTEKENSNVTEAETGFSVLWPLFVPLLGIITLFSLFFSLAEKLAEKMRDEIKKDE